MRWVRRGIVSLVLLTLLACGVHLSNSGNDPLPDRPPESLRVASLNVHYIVTSQQTGPWSLDDWERRKRPMDAAFKEINADLIALQEAESFPGTNSGGPNLILDWLLNQNPSFAVAAHGPADQFPPTQPILYRPDRLTLLDQGWFFFSDTPDVIYSRTFNGSYPAFATWAEFDAGGARFRVVNVHFEFSSRSNRQLSAQLVAERIAPWLDRSERVLLLGDLNARLGSATANILSAQGLEFAPVDGATFHFNRGLNLFGAIDHLALSQGMQLATPVTVLRRTFLGEWPSDHYPIVGDLLPQ